MSFMVNTRYVGDELFLRKFAFHKVTNAAAGHDISPNVTLFIADAINAGIFHAGQPFSVGASSVRWRLSTVKTILCNYFGNLLKRKIELSPISLRLTAILTMNPPRRGISGTGTRKANSSSEPASIPNAASPSIFQMSNRQGLFSSASTTHNPMVYRGEPQFSSLFRVRPSMTDNCKVTKFLICNVDEFHRG